MDVIGTLRKAKVGGCLTANYLVLSIALLGLALRSRRLHHVSKTWNQVAVLERPGRPLAGN